MFEKKFTEHLESCGAHLDKFGSEKKIDKEKIGAHITNSQSSFFVRPFEAGKNIAKDMPLASKSASDLMKITLKSK